MANEIKFLDIIQSIGICASLICTVYMIFRDIKRKKIENYIFLTQNHRELWKLAISKPSFLKLFKKTANKKISPEETTFLTLFFLHITCSYQLHKESEIIEIEQLKKDISECMLSPAIYEFWKSKKTLYNKDFIDFIESSIT